MSCIELRDSISEVIILA